MDTREQHPVDDIQKRPAHAISKSGEGVSAPEDLVYLHHPGYDDDNESVLFTLPTCSMNNVGQPCAEYAVASQGCYAVALNRPGFFTTRKGRDSERAQHGQGLIPGHYWYHLDEGIEEHLYATGLRFRAWQYVPEEMPNAWREAAPWRGSEDQDQESEDCCITGEDGGVETAHLVERTEWQWWIENNMTEHSSTAGLTRATETIGLEMSVPGNLIPLSGGLHRVWDSNFFCLFPLKMANGTWRLHCIFVRPLEKAVRNHHRRPLRGGLRHTSAACAYSRFVSCIYRKYESTFLAKPVRRFLGGSKTAPGFLSAEDIMQQRQERVRNTSPSKKNRSGSPRKRTHSESQPNEDEDEALYWDRQDEDSQPDSAVSLDFGCSMHRGRLETRAKDAQRAMVQDERWKRRRLSVSTCLA